MPPDRIVEPLHPEEDLIGFVLVTEAGWLERLNEIDIEVTLGLGGRSIVGRTEEQIAVALYPVALPFYLVLPDLMAGDICVFVRPLHELPNSTVISAIKHVVG